MRAEPQHLCAVIPCLFTAHTQAVCAPSRRLPTVRPRLIVIYVAGYTYADAWIVAHLDSPLLHIVGDGCAVVIVKRSPPLCRIRRV